MQKKKERILYKKSALTIELSALKLPFDKRTWIPTERENY